MGVAAALVCSCKQADKSEVPADPDADLLVKRREDGTISSINQVDEMGIVHGTRVTFYADGKTVYSKINFEHGFRQGPSVRYYENGQVFEYSNYQDGERHGPQRKYYKSGELLATFSYDHGRPLPGLKEYLRDGTLLDDYPDVEFREIDHLSDKNRIDLEISCTWKKGDMKFYILQKENGTEDRVYLITENGSATMQFFVQPGETLDRNLEFIAEIPTDLGNILVLEPTYHLRVRN
jgi:hypothetical protein